MVPVTTITVEMTTVNTSALISIVSVSAEMYKVTKDDYMRTTDT